MKDVVCYRLEENDGLSLQQLARKKGMPLATITSKIIERYLNYYRIIEESGYVSLPKQALKILLNLVSESKFDSIVEAVVKQAMVDIRLRYGEATYENILRGAQRWFENNDMALVQFNNAEHTKYVCKHELGLNWSKLATQILGKLLESELTNVDLKDDMFTFELKNTNLR